MRKIFFNIALFCIVMLLIIVNTNGSLVSVISLCVAIICCIIGMYIDDETDNKKFEDIIRRKG